jgi:tetratricopeptide (TPR) repeat protein
MPIPQSDSFPRMEPWPHVRRCIDALLTSSLALAAALLGCQPLSDPDVWWHLRSGEWIIEQRRVPTLDPFTFASADRLWVDLHWLFQVVLALVNRVGGVPGIILLTAALSGLTLLVIRTGRGRNWPTWISVVVWLPAVYLVACRAAPRPEIVSVFFLAVYLAILFHCDQHPALIWVLPPLQVLWVNAHGLFVLGPIVLTAWLADAALRAAVGQRPREAGLNRPPTARWWWHVGTAFSVVLLACLCNPYGIRGVLLPLEIFPKIAGAGNPYKSNIEEFMNLRSFVTYEALPVATRSFFVRNLAFLLMALPVSFIAHAVWCAWRWAPRAPTPSRPGARPAMAWLGLLGAGLGLTLVGVLGIPLPGTPAWQVELGRWVPASLVALGLVAAALVVRRSALAASLGASGGLAVAGALLTLQAYLVGPPESAGWSLRSVGMLLVGLLVVIQVLSAGGRVVRIILAASFSYLALQAYRNANLFGLVAGFVIALNLEEAGAGALAEGPIAPACERAGQFVRFALSALIIVGIIFAVTRAIPVTNGEVSRLSLQEYPFVFAHDAARFAGRPGMPERALVFNLEQSSVYLFHNGPRHKLFIDPRLEVPSRATFESYVRLEKALNSGDPRWVSVVARMGDLLIMLGHANDAGASATLMTHPSWRCVYFDHVASVFLPSGRTDLAGPFPTVDFVARHFAQASDLDSRGPKAAELEAWALNTVAWALRVRGSREAAWPHRIPVALCAFDLARRTGSSWLIADAFWNLCLDSELRRPGPSVPWDPALGLTESQATYSYRRDIDHQPPSSAALSTLESIFEARRMYDARDLVTRSGGDASGQTIIDLSPKAPLGDLPSDLSRAIAELLLQHRPLAAVALAREAERNGRTLPWETADRVAAALLHLGDPASAHRVWDRAAAPPSIALRLARVAEAELASLNFEAAARSLHAALERDPRLGEAWFVLALLCLQSGDAAGTRSACGEGLACPLTDPQRSAMEHMLKLASRPS